MSAYLDAESGAGYGSDAAPFASLDSGASPGAAFLNNFLTAYTQIRTAELTARASSPDQAVVPATSPTQIGANAQEKRMLLIGGLIVGAVVLLLVLKKG